MICHEKNSIIASKIPSDKSSNKWYASLRSRPKTSNHIILYRCIRQKMDHAFTTKWSREKWQKQKAHMSIASDALFIFIIYFIFIFSLFAYFDLNKKTLKCLSFSTVCVSPKNCCVLCRFNVVHFTALWIGELPTAETGTVPRLRVRLVMGKKFFHSCKSLMFFFNTIYKKIYFLSQFQHKP